jgi:predicted MFS family arabinose efflux permease
MLLLVFALTEGNDSGWTSTRILAMLGGAVLLLVLFVIAETAQKRPMLDLRLFRKPAFVGVSIVAFVMSAAGFSMFLYLTLYLQTVLDFGPLAAGLRFLPITVVAFLLAPVAGGLSTRVPARVFLALGLAMVGVGLLLMHGVTATSSWTTLLGGFVALGAGIGLVNPPLASAAVGVVPPERSGMASGINTTFREVGMAVGIAGLGAAFQTRVETKITDALAKAPAVAGRHAHALAHQLASGDAQAAIGSVAPASRGIVGAAFRGAFVSGLQEILVIAAVVAFAGAALGLVLIRPRDFVTDPRSGEHIVVGH